ncbi:MAG: rubredoxin [Bacteroidales bacterium]|jgi:rubredoxin
MKKYRCMVCGHVYDEAEGDSMRGLPPGTKFEDLPEDWTCPVCGVLKEEYVEIEE